VHATTRSAGKQAKLRGLGATPVVVDALDATALEHAVRQAQPTHVIHQLTALPPMGPRRARDLEPTNRLRDEGTRHLLRAAIAAHAQRIVVGSFAPVAAAGDASGDAQIDGAVAAVRSMESQVIDAARRGAIEAIVLRYGLFYGPGNPGTDECSIEGGVITGIRVVRNPDKLVYLARQLNTQPFGPASHVH
jgi:nucleoside-diphosphate-sugar epimerase